jgi:putative ABC transport system ATP-binding protein
MTATAPQTYPIAVPAEPPALLLDGITKTYRSKAGAVDALRGVTYHFQRGSFTAVMGPSGSGKSTLLQCAAGLDHPTSGTVVLGGKDLSGLNEVALTKLRREEMGFVFQAYNLLPSLTVYDNVALPLRLTGRRLALPCSPTCSRTRCTSFRFGRRPVSRRGSATLSYTMSDGSRL